MKRIIYIFIFLYPFVGITQQPLDNSYPLDYMWKYVGNEGFSPGIVWYTSLALNPSDSQPYVAYLDYLNSQKASVKRFDGTNWIDVGNEDFSAGEATYISLAFNPSTGQPYVAYADNA